MLAKEDGKTIIGSERGRKRQSERGKEVEEMIKEGWKGKIIAWKRKISERRRDDNIKVK